MTVSKLTKSTDVYEVQQKTNEIIDGYLPLTGGTLTGSLYFQGASNKNFGFVINDNNANCDIGWEWATTAGAGGAFRSVNYSVSSERGDFIIWARSSSGTKKLIGKPSGSLKWDGQDILRANSNLNATKLTGTIDTARIPIDNSTITVNGSGKLQATGGGSGGADTTLSNVSALSASFISLLTTNGFIPQTYLINNSDGYIVFSNKLCFQWGTHGNSNSAIPLVITMANTDYLVFSTRIASGSGVAYTKATTTITPSTAWAANWMVVGVSA